jgi:hypothetical protein
VEGKALEKKRSLAMSGFCSRIRAKIQKSNILTVSGVPNQLKDEVMKKKLLGP